MGMGTDASGGNQVRILSRRSKKGYVLFYGELGAVQYRTAKVNLLFVFSITGYDQSHSPVVQEIIPSPIDQHHNPVAETNQLIDVYD